MADEITGEFDAQVYGLWVQWRRTQSIRNSVVINIYKDAAKSLMSLRRVNKTSTKKSTVNSKKKRRLHILRAVLYRRNNYEDIPNSLYTTHLCTFRRREFSSRFYLYDFFQKMIQIKLNSFFSYWQKLYFAI